MKTETEHKIEREEELLEVIKSHLFESLDVLKNLELKKDKDFCDDCKNIVVSKRMRTREGKRYCYRCYVKHYPILQLGDTNNYIPEENKPLILNNTKQSQPIIDDVVLPITEPSVIEDTPKEIIKINLLEGLNEKQINFIKSQVDIGANPMGFTIYTDIGEVYYFGTFLGVVK